MTLLSCESVFGATTLIAVVICFVTYVKQIQNVGADSCLSETSKQIAKIVAPMVSVNLQQIGVQVSQYTDLHSDAIRAGLHTLETTLYSTTFSFTLVTIDGVILATTEFDTTEGVQRPLPHSVDKTIRESLEIAAARSDGMQILPENHSSVYAMPVPHFNDLVLCVLTR